MLCSLVPKEDVFGLQAGAILQDCIDCHTSIVISPRVLSPNDAVTKLEAIPATVTTVPFIYQKRSLQFPTGESSQFCISALTMRI